MRQNILVFSRDAPTVHVAFSRIIHIQTNSSASVIKFAMPVTRVVRHKIVMKFHIESYSFHEYINPCMFEIEIELRFNTVWSTLTRDTLTRGHNIARIVSWSPNDPGLYLAQWLLSCRILLMHKLPIRSLALYCRCLTRNMILWNICIQSFNKNIIFVNLKWV